jgi:hypothetical protein
MVRRSVMIMMRTSTEHPARLAELLALGRRDQMLQIVYQQWLKKDLVKAGAALQKSSLYDERKRFLQPQAGTE